MDSNTFEYLDNEFCTNLPIYESLSLIKDICELCELETSELEELSTKDKVFGTDRYGFRIHLSASSISDSYTKLKTLLILASKYSGYDSEFTKTVSRILNLTNKCMIKNGINNEWSDILRKGRIETTTSDDDPLPIYTGESDSIQTYSPINYPDPTYTSTASETECVNSDPHKYTSVDSIKEDMIKKPEKYTFHNKDTSKNEWWRNFYGGCESEEEYWRRSNDDGDFGLEDDV